MAAACSRTHRLPLKTLAELVKKKDRVRAVTSCTQTERQSETSISSFSALSRTRHLGNRSILLVVEARTRYRYGDDRGQRHWTMSAA